MSVSKFKLSITSSNQRCLTFIFYPCDTLMLCTTNSLRVEANNIRCPSKLISVIVSTANIFHCLELKLLYSVRAQKVHTSPMDCHYFF